LPILPWSKSDDDAAVLKAGEVQEVGEGSAVLVAHSTPLDERYRQLLANLTNYFGTHGFSHTDAVMHAQA